MTYLVRYVGPGGSDSNDGTTKPLRKLTIQAMESALSAATRYTVRIYPGTYRELDTLAVSGPAPYTTGTVSVTLGSLTVTGTGTAWLANAEANDWFQVLKFASGTDGVTNGTSTFVSAAGNFQAGHVGMTIRIDTKVAGIIATVVGPTTITLADTAGAALTPAAGVALTYDVGPSGPIKIASVESDTSLTLAAAWDFPTLTGLAYSAWGHIEYVGDYLGTLTDGVGGVVRMTGSDNDQTEARANCIIATSRNQRTFRTILFDTASNYLMKFLTACSKIVIDKCFFDAASDCIDLAGTGTGCTVMNCYFRVPFGSAAGVIFTHSASVVNGGNMVQSCYFDVGSFGVNTQRVGGTRIRNCTFVGGTACVNIGTALSTGQAVTVNDNIFQVATTALNATAVGEIQENYNTFYRNTTNRTNVTTGANSKTYPPLFDTRWFFQLVSAGAGPYSALQVVSPFDLASYSQLANLAGLNPSLTDMRGTAVQGAQREWGALELDTTLKTFGGIHKGRIQVGQ